jgi:hypothetical protein
MDFFFKKNRLFAMVLFFASMGLLLSCDDPLGPDEDSNDTTEEREENDDEVETFEYAVGDIGPAGGWIFFVDEDSRYAGWTYLEAWTEDQEGPRFAWKSHDTFTGGTSTAIGRGYHNTYTALVNDPSLMVSHSAASSARSATHGGYSDWFLPSSDELKQMYLNLHLDGIGEFSSDPESSYQWDSIYWSSSESGALYAQTFDFSSGDLGSNWKKYWGDGRPRDYLGLRVRVARSF